MDFSTIAAVSTPPGKGGVALLRVSGREALAVAEQIFRPFSEKKIEEYPCRYQIYGNIVSLQEKKVLDDCLLTYFRAPHSFTGEDVVEIACHGGEVITGMILSQLLLSGAVMAKPGEFSRRAFMNGKLSLTAAEGIADLLDAKTEAAALLSSKTVRGKLSDTISNLSEQILFAASSLWAYLDYPEEDLQTMGDGEMLSHLEGIIASCQKLLDSFETGRAIQSGIPAVIVGKPNVGKSTFFNLFLGEEKAIVTSVPGTTRDVIEYPVTAGRVLLNLADTAGMRGNAADQVEEIGIEKALSVAKDSKLIFALFDRSRPLDGEDEMVLDLLRDCKDEKKIIPILTKCDLEEKLSCEPLAFLGEPLFLSKEKEFDFSALSSTVERMFISDESALEEGQIITNIRQKTNLEKTVLLLSEAMEHIACGAKDIASLTLESALSALLEIDGKSAGEKILDQVFSRFCIGK